MATMMLRPCSDGCGERLMTPAPYTCPRCRRQRQLILDRLRRRKLSNGGRLSAAEERGQAIPKQYRGSA